MRADRCNTKERFSCEKLNATTLQDLPYILPNTPHCLPAEKPDKKQGRLPPHQKNGCSR
jgi:hypothetical protein